MAKVESEVGEFKIYHRCADRCGWVSHSQKSLRNYIVCPDCGALKPASVIGRWHYVIRTTFLQGRVRVKSIFQEKGTWQE